ncbi:MBL fold metallo-hydrolase [Microbulbifer sp. OS29]|uniref:MBL fold metallo-hydrolase n=1 Tax=Microbulbifer okhotskensis TaxID=2926617 RepID=A0A9X2J5Q3_9GAMM|nr:MBL fold metallo-hydrolase [Microbulbifer okhotskensis]MCO1333840.1 MBL fold metallo-hydrolase [Microbulbifer okhotskensis]
MPLRESFNYQGLDAIRVGRINMGVNTTFIVYRLNGTLIDTGPSNQWKYVKPFVQNTHLEQLLLTHHHEDHSGNAGAIHELTGVQAAAPDLTIGILERGFRIPPMQKFFWGTAGKAEVAPLPEDLRIGREEVVPLFSPGHAKDMTCYLLPERGWLFSADLYIANYLKFLRIDEHIPTLLNSIKRVLDCSFDVILCPHRGVVEDGWQQLNKKYEYLLNLTGEAQVLQEQGLPLEQITQRLLGKEGLLSIMTGYNFCKRNLIASCLHVNLTEMQRF